MMWRVFFMAVGIMLLGACAAKPLLPGAGAVILSKEAAAPGCQLIGEVQGSQGNFWTAEFTGDAKLIAGARNELRNAAYAVHANYVKIETEAFSHNTASDSLGGTFSAVVIGNAFRWRFQLMDATLYRRETRWSDCNEEKISSYWFHGGAEDGAMGPLAER